LDDRKGIWHVENLLLAIPKGPQRYKVISGTVGQSTKAAVNHKNKKDNSIKLHKSE